MKTIRQWIYDLESGALDGELTYLYGEPISRQKQRHVAALKAYEANFAPDVPVAIFSAPGRTEIGGNHTDHQRGRVLAGAVTMDMLAVAAPAENGMVTIVSEGYGKDTVDLSDLTCVEKEVNTSKALIRGVAAGLHQRGYAHGGFNAYLMSDVPQGSGLSSSAAYEVLLGTIFNGFYNNQTITPVEIAQIGQYAENAYFKKPSGLMDQMASSVGSVCSIDFQDPANPAITRMEREFAQMGYALYVVNAGGSHAGLTEEYAAIPLEMHMVSQQFGKEVLRDVDENDFYERMGQLRGTVPDRALLRAIHFFDENARVPLQIDALERGDGAAFCRLMLASGASSLGNLQNIYPANSIEERSVSLALALCAHALAHDGAWRVHGGGFAGTVQALVPMKGTESFRQIMEQAFGRGSVHPLRIRPVGGYMLGKSLYTN